MWVLTCINSNGRAGPQMPVGMKPSPVPFHCDTVLAMGEKKKQCKGPPSPHVMHWMAQGLETAHSCFVCAILKKLIGSYKIFACKSCLQHILRNQILSNIGTTTFMATIDNDQIVILLFRWCALCKSLQPSPPAVQLCMPALRRHLHLGSWPRWNGIQALCPCRLHAE